MLGLVPQVWSDLPRNREQPGAAYGSFALKALQFRSALAHETDLAILTNFLTI